jgi:phosphohistidine phosphatase SixA
MNCRWWGTCALALAGMAHAAEPAPGDAWNALADGSIVLMRHAEAPGVGDPGNFRLGDCATQRNLDAAGRAQARRIGERFRAQRVPVRAVYTSQWCRTRETAELAFPGLARDEPAFNSFFGNDGAAPAQTAAASSILARWRGPGVLVVVTHQVNITALSGIHPASGEGVVVRPKGEALEVVSRLQPAR